MKYRDWAHDQICQKTLPIELYHQYRFTLSLSLSLFLSSQVCKCDFHMVKNQDNLAKMLVLVAC